MIRCFGKKLLIMVLILLVSACTKSYLKEKTIEEIREFKKQGKPVSELDKCLIEAEKDDKKFQSSIIGHQSS